MKKYICFLLVLAVGLVVWLCLGPAALVDSANSDYKLKNIGDDSIEIEKYTGNTNSEIIIPETINGRRVVSIGQGAFSGHDEITSIMFPDSLKKIGKSAFWGCDGITTVILPEGLEEIGEEAFYECDNLKKLAIPKNVKKIGVNAFYYCFQLRVGVYKDSYGEKYCNEHLVKHYTIKE